MMHINLLPRDYQQDRQAERLPMGHVALVIAVIATVLIAELGQHLRHRRVARQLATVNVAYTNKQDEMETLASIQQKLVMADKEALLGASLLNQPATSRLLATIANAAPRELLISRIHTGIHRKPQAPPPQPRGRRIAAVHKPTSRPVDQERQRLKADAVAGVSILIEGVAPAIANVNKFVRSLNEQRLGKFELENVRAAGANFEYRIVAFPNASTNPGASQATSEGA